jgi:hypothetical protein
MLVFVALVMAAGRCFSVRALIKRSKFLPEFGIISRKVCKLIIMTVYSAFQ